MNGQSNVDRLVKAGIIDDTKLTQAGRDAINKIDLTDDEIYHLQSIQKKLNLGPIPLTGPDQQPGIGVWHL
jgi:hypothetical protein